VAPIIVLLPGRVRRLSGMKAMQHLYSLFRVGLYTNARENTYKR